MRRSVNNQLIRSEPGRMALDIMGMGMDPGMSQLLDL